MDTDDKERRSDKVMPVEETDAPGGWEPIGTAGLVGTSRRLSQEMAERRRAEAAVRASETRLRAIVNAVPDVLCVLDEDGRYVEILTS